MKICVTGLCLFIEMVCFAQPVSTLHFEKIEGLSQSTAYSIMKDGQGFLWIATANGLNRFDGIEMKTYKPSLETSPGQMKGRIIRSDMLEDGQDRIWFSTDIAVHCFDKRKGKFSTYDLSHQSQGNGNFANPLLLQDSHLWFANANADLFDLNIVSGKCANYRLSQKDEAGNPIQLMYHGTYDEHGKLWFASNKGLFSFDIASKYWQRYFPDHSFYSIAYCQGLLYISEGKEVAEVSPVSLQNNRALFNDQHGMIRRDLLHCVYADKKCNVWVGDEKGNVYCKRRQDSRFNWTGNINGNIKPTTSYPVYYFYADTSGILWVGAYVLGLLKAETDQPGFGIFPAPENKITGENFFVNTIYEDKDDKVWMGTFEKGIVILDKATGKTSPLTLPYSGPHMTYGNLVPLIRTDSKGNVWTSLSGYLFVREKNAHAFLPIKIPPPSNALQVPQLWSFSEYKDGWLIGTTVGFYVVSKNRQGYKLRHLPSLGQVRSYDIWVNNNEEIWFAFESGGLAVATKIDRMDDCRKLFTETNVRSFLHDEAHGLLWISTSSGLIAYHLSTASYRNFTEVDGLPSSYIYGALAGGNELWISTNYGLSRGIVSFVKDSVLPEVHFTNFTSADGLPDNQFNARAFYKGKSGNFYFGTVSGLTWFKPPEVSHKKSLPRLNLVDLRVNENVADSSTTPEYTRSLSLSHDQNNLFFSFRGIDFRDAKRIHYAYQMEGWDKEWIYSNQLNQVRYSNLPYGKYLFKVKAANSSGIWNENAYAISVVIRPPFWRTGWFYSMIFVLATCVVIWITRIIAQRKLIRKILQLEKLHAIEAERSRISRDMHDEIGSGLTHIALASEMIQTQKKENDEWRREVGDISMTARRLVESMSEIVWALNPQNDTLENLIAYLREQTMGYFEPFDLCYSVDFPSEIPSLSLTHEQRRNLFLVIKEALNNALKHSCANKIRLCMSVENKNIQFKVCDNGGGFDTSRQKIGSNGLNNMKKRMTEIGGSFSVYRAEEGTVVEISFPMIMEPATTFFTSKKNP